MVGVNFFLTSSPILDLGHFSQVILPIVLQAICPTIRCCSQHLMVGVIFFFTSDFANCTTDYAPTISCCSQYLMVGVFFTCSQILDLGDFSQIILPQPKNNPNHQVLFTASDGWGYFFFFDLFSHSGLRAFFTSEFANCTTNYAPAQK